MKSSKIMRNFLLFCLVCGFLFAFFLFTESVYTRKLQAENLENYGFYLKPTYKPGVRHLTRVQILIQDGNGNSNSIIDGVTFNGKNLKLYPESPSKDRGSYNTQLAPGSYLLIWKVKMNRNSYQTKEFRKQIQITESDVWIDIRIEGSEVTIT